MLGCVARADTEEVHQDLSEMEAVRWVERGEVAAAVEASTRHDHITHTGVALCYAQFKNRCWSLHNGARSLAFSQHPRKSPWFRVCGSGAVEWREVAVESGTCHDHITHTGPPENTRPLCVTFEDH